MTDKTSTNGRHLGHPDFDEMEGLRADQERSTMHEQRRGPKMLVNGTILGSLAWGFIFLGALALGLALVMPFFADAMESPRPFACAGFASECVAAAEAAQ